MTISNKPITELDFTGVRNQLREYLKGQTRFKDFDFAGSNMAVLLDVLAYNTYQNNFYTNMAISEMFLDSASRRDSVVSHAKELNYLPRSAKSAKAIVNLAIEVASNSSVVSLPKRSVFTATYQGRTFNFYTNKTHTLKRTATVSTNGGVVVNRYLGENIEVFEGRLVSETFFLTEDSPILALSNPNIDTDSIEVFVETDTGNEEYVYKKDIFGVQENDPVYYLQPEISNAYSIEFGRDKFGKQPALNQKIAVSYIISSTKAPNVASTFSYTFNGARTQVVTVSAASGGRGRENADGRALRFEVPVQELRVHR
jgi:hypothetical protein